MSIRIRATALVAVIVFGTAASAAAQPPRELYTRALARDRAVRDAGQKPTRQQIRSAIAAYERVVRRYPTSGYCDNALWQAGELARLAWERFGEDIDRSTGIRVLKLLRSGYPSSPLVAGVDTALGQFDVVKASPSTAKPVPAVVSDASLARAVKPSVEETTVAASGGGPVTVRGITRTPLPDGVRVSIEMDRELVFRQEQLENPRRLFFDLREANPIPGLRDKTLTFQDDIVREIRLGRHPQNTTRIVLDTEGVESYSVFTLYSPYRLIVDFRRRGAPPVAQIGPLVPPAVPTTGLVLPGPAPRPAPIVPTSPPAPISALPPPPLTAPPSLEPPLTSRDIPTTPLPALPAPALPSANSNGAFSLARQLGLGISRIVLDPGHGGHDPGARGSGLSEAELVLDVTLRLKKLLEKQPGIEVTLTRESDVFIPLDERTAIANRKNADLFLSIHANASRNPKASGVETYFLNFAANPEAEAVAARENSASGQTMHNLPDIVRAIALNNKIDESRDFAETIQKAMVRKLSVKNKELRDLGVKQAPFVVLIGAGMPSVLAEISFVTHKQEGQLLKTGTYRQQIAEALFDAITNYQKSLKSRTTIAAREE